MDFKVYVSLGFHINLYHSWRGDTPDEAGFGTDIRVIREVLKILERANAAGLKARAYWDAEVYWTFQEILPKHAPDILEGMRRRVDRGLDEIVVGPFNNGANHAASADEFRASIAWALENEWGSGLRQLFGKVAPFYRSQETMFTTGQETILKEYGMHGLILYYAGVPFNTISNFIPTLTLEQRYNPLWFRTAEDQPPLILLPAISAGDLFEQVSLENLICDLHRRQQSGEIQADVLIHLNEDADLETWLPIRLPKALAWFPNTGGLEEYIRVVNKYPWADFTLPSEYAAAHPPRAEVIVRQDLADGAFDGNYSWAEKSGSLHAWTLLEQSRLASYRAETLARRSCINLDEVLWDGTDSAFFQRLIGLTTTHFGMSTPVINEERQLKAFSILGKARKMALDAERFAVRSTKHRSNQPALYEFELVATPPSRDDPAVQAHAAVSLPLVLPAGVKSVYVEDGSHSRLRASLTGLKPLPDDRLSAQLRFITNLEASDSLRVSVHPSPSPTPPPFVKRLTNQWLQVDFSEKEGIANFTCNGDPVGGPGFLAPFVTYGKHSYHAAAYTFESLDAETWDGLQRVRLKTRIPMRIPAGEYASELTYTFTLFDDLPYLFVDVDVQYAYTPPRQVIHNLTQKLRRLMDLHWVETAPFQLTPALTAPADQPLRIWKHNYMGKTAWFDLNYGQINPRNRSLDSFNHQVTAGWVALSNGQSGLLLAENAETLTSMAFCPMRLRERDGKQTISLNPFGSYYGKQFDYSHLGGNGTGKGIMQTFSGALQPNGPSFNGETLHFSLMLAPYAGSEPPQALQDDAAAHFYPPGVILHHAPQELQAEISDDILIYIAAEQRRAWLSSNPPLHPPTAFLANPSHNAVDLVWDAPRQSPVTGYEIAWRASQDSAWQSQTIDLLTRLHLDDLVDGQPMQFKIRSIRGDEFSDWSTPAACTPGAVTDSSILPMLKRLPIWTLIRVVLASIGSVLRIK